MPTQEERLTSIEQTFALFRKETGKHIREVDENTTIMLGVMRNQGQDIRRTVEHLETIDERLNSLEQGITAIDQRLNSLDQSVNTIDQRFSTFQSRYETTEEKLDQVLALLTTLKTKPDQET